MARFQVRKAEQPHHWSVVAATTEGTSVLYYTDEEIVAEDFASRMNMAFDRAMMETHDLMVIAAQGEV